MKIRNLIIAFFILSTSYAGSAMAQNLIELSDDPAALQGGTTMISATWTDNGATSNTLQFDVDFNDAEFSFSSCTVQAPYNAAPYISSCMLPVGDTDTVRFVTFQVPNNPIPSGTVIVIEFNVLAGPGSYQMNVSGVVTADGEATDTDPALIEVLGPSYNSTNPAPGDPIPFGSHTAGDADPTQTMTIDNDGAVGTTLNGSCALGGANPGAFTLANAAFSVPEAGPNDDVTVGCDSSALVPGNYSATLSCSHDGDANPASPVNYALTCTINAAPSPEYGSTPAPGSTIEFGTFTTADPPADEMVTIENVGNADGLDGACSITNNPNGAYSIDTGANYGPLAQMATAARTVTCNTTILGDHDGGVLSCTHNGTAIASPATYTLNCGVEPTPQYDSTPAIGATIDLGDYPQNNTPTDGSLTITNVGEAGSTLSGTCSMLDGSVISVVGGGAYSADVGSPAMIDLTCDTSAAQGDYSDTLSCTHNDGDGDPTSPAAYTVECGILPPDPAIYDSTPAPGATIDLTPGGAVPEGTDLTNAAQLAIRNAAEPGDDFLDLMGCAITAGSTEITANPTPVDNDIDVGDPDVVVNFSCDTTVAGTYSATYTCPFDDNPSAPAPVPAGVGVMSPALYTVTCDVREPFSEVVETPTSGTPQTAEVGPGESHTFSFLFEEVLDEGLAASLDDCSLASGTDFAITSPASFPQTIPSGGSVQVDVQFTDPGAGDTFTDTLNCTYTDNQDGGEPEQTPVSWPLEVNVTGRNVRFRVTKDFSDDNPLGVEVLLECNTGLPLQQQGTVHDPDAVGLGPGDFTHLDFVVVDFEPGTMDCDVSEAVPAGYEASYFADIGEDGVAGGVSDDGDGCHYEDLESADFICEISNELLPVTVTVNKEWVDDNPSFNLPTFVEVTLHCNAPVVFLIEPGPGGDQLSGDNGFTLDQFIDPSNPGIFGVFPHWDGTTECFVTEEVDAGVLPDLTDCESIPLAPGVDGECTIVNTRLFAGIPTLSQYGLILMALLMLGVGALGFRRYA